MHVPDRRKTCQNIYGGRCGQISNYVANDFPWHQSTIDFKCIIQSLLWDWHETVWDGMRRYETVWDVSQGKTCIKKLLSGPGLPVQPVDAYSASYSLKISKIAYVYQIEIPLLLVYLKILISLLETYQIINIWNINDLSKCDSKHVQSMQLFL